VRGGMGLPREVDQFARKAVSELAGHARIRASGAYIGQSVIVRTKAPTPALSVELSDSDDRR
jgi:hypothetical protein